MVRSRPGIGEGADPFLRTPSQGVHALCWAATLGWIDYALEMRVERIPPSTLLFE
jgi:hypothetical protein